MQNSIRVICDDLENGPGNIGKWSAGFQEVYVLVVVEISLQR